MSHLRKSVLIIDDAPERRTEAGQLMEQFGFAVAYAGSGSEAVKVYEANPFYDLVAVRLDLSGGINSYTVARLIRYYQLAKRPFIVGLTETAVENTRALSSGMDLLAVWPLAASISNVLPFMARG